MNEIHSPQPLPSHDGLNRGEATNVGEVLSCHEASPELKDELKEAVAASQYDGVGEPTSEQLKVLQMYNLRALTIVRPQKSGDHTRVEMLHTLGDDLACSASVFGFSESGDIGILRFKAKLSDQQRRIISNLRIVHANLYALLDRLDALQIVSAKEEEIIIQENESNADTVADARALTKRLNDSGSTVSNWTVDDVMPQPFALRAGRYASSSQQSDAISVSMVDQYAKLQNDYLNERANVICMWADTQHQESQLIKKMAKANGYDASINISCVRQLLLVLDEMNGLSDE